MSGIILGPGLIGEEASKKAQRTAVDDAGGGAIQIGPGIINTKKFGKAREAAKAAAAPIPAAAPVAAVVAARTAAPTTEPANPGLSEDDIEIMLAADPNAWDIVAEAEGKRAEGFRPRVAKMLLLAAPDAKDKPMAPEIAEHLTRIAEVGLKADASKLADAVGAVEVGTGDPEAVAPEAPKAPRRARR